MKMAIVVLFSITISVLQYLCPITLPNPSKMSRIGEFLQLMTTFLCRQFFGFVKKCLAKILKKNWRRFLKRKKEEEEYWTRLMRRIFHFLKWLNFIAIKQYFKSYHVNDHVSFFLFLQIFWNLNKKCFNRSNYFSIVQSFLKKASQQISWEKQIKQIKYFKFLK